MMMLLAADLSAQIPPLIGKSANPQSISQADTVRPITVTEAIDLALKQASNYKGSQISEQIAREDVRQAQAAFYPKVAVLPNLIYTSPSLAAGSPRPPSFLGANAITEYQAVLNASGEVDISGKLKAALRRSKALVESARAGTEVAKRDLIQAVIEAYFTLALSTTQRRGSENNLSAARDFENNTKLQVDAGEVAPVDLIRARLQTAARLDELAQAMVNEIVNADTLRFLTGKPELEPIAAVDLLTNMPADDEIERYTEAAISTRPEFAQFEADRRAADQDAAAARAERRPQLTYSVSGGFITDSLRPLPVRDHTGVQANVGVSIPLFDRGASRSRETQAKLKLQQVENTKLLSERQFFQAFNTARSQAVSARERIRKLGASIADAEQNLSASTARYRAGEAPINEVVDAQNLFITQRLSLYKAIFDYQTAKAHLSRAAGQ